VWTKTDASGQGSDCVDVAKLGAIMGVRDSKRPTNDILAFSFTSFPTMTEVLTQP
jgi:hypothetical protein